MKRVNLKIRHHGYQMDGSDKYKQERMLKKSESFKSDADVCLNCTKKECNGGKGCFERKKKYNTD